MIREIRHRSLSKFATRSLHCAVVCLALLLPSGAKSPNASANAIDVYDGFETATLSNVWDTDRFAPGAVEMQSAIVRAGHGAVKITVRPHDVFEAGINGNSDSERAELLEARQLTSRENEAYEHSFSMFFPANFAIVPTRLVIAQWKQYCPKGGNCSDDSPVLAVRYISGVLRITQDLGLVPHICLVLADVGLRLRLTRASILTGKTRWERILVVVHHGPAAGAAALRGVERSARAYSAKIAAWARAMSCGRISAGSIAAAPS